MDSGPVEREREKVEGYKKLIEWSSSNFRDKRKEFELALFHVICVSVN